VRRVSGALRRSKSLPPPDKRIAKRALDRRLGEIAEGRLRLPQTQSAPKLREWTEQFLSTIADNNTKKRYASSVRNLLNFLGQTKLCDISIDHIDDFVESRKAEDVGPATINRDLAVLRRILRLAQRRRYIAFNPFDQVEMLNESRGRRQARILSFAEERRIESVIPQNSYFYPLLRVLVETGLRVYSEALRLRRCD
jgi:site-specific recombinase XerD